MAWALFANLKPNITVSKPKEGESDPSSLRAPEIITHESKQFIGNNLKLAPVLETDRR